MKKVLMLLITLTPCLVSAANLSVANGIDIHTINGKTVEKIDARTYSLIEGSNQLAVTFSGKLSNGPKSEYLSTKPYVLLFEVTSDDVDLTLISRRFKDVEKAIDNDMPIFDIRSNGSELSSQQELLPPVSDYLPYANVPLLVTAYNQNNKISFSNGELENVAELAEGKDATVVDKLKNLYLEANTEQRKTFRKWMIDQE
ncbi:DUF2057 domain-containing protein [Vibrio aestuarianus]|uniref:DUF2057 family protein n=1 Tax=Vibrio aestuarianus TaxID=28171 RepID=UPI001559FEF3|nr:DUF2057 family protein [Vibrio aestuarianus]NGZ14453.1 DUF2057 domain-containing protein [Vibrio aestuarianus]NKZ50601.1 DUF2057 domain-containing protein [Vibrio aestuarianus]CAH8236364.1 conserved exported hypothetical protein [Vibrio aestuarianus]